MKKNIFLFLITGLLLVNCNNDDDQPIVEETQPVVLDNEINDFVWGAMNSWYLWQDEVLELGDDRFENEDEYITFLNQFNTPRGLFQTVLSPRDRFSVIVDDYDRLFNSFAGVFKTDGIEYSLTRPPEGGNAVIAVVRYIIDGSNAANTDIKRGDIIYAVNDISLFAETDNENNITASNLDLLNPDTVILNFADIVDDKLVPNGINVEVTKTQITENPILISKTLEVGGTKIGYLMYNSFTGNFDSELNEAFGQFKSEGVSELVVDLRYNLGGSVLSATRLASMITGQFTGELFAREQWNDRWQPFFGSDNIFVDDVNGAPINHLNLDEIYVLTTGDSASASELLINGLTPYITVNQIGEVTLGKVEFSITLLDNPDQTAETTAGTTVPLPYRIKSEKTIEDANPNHKYAMQPLVGTNVNAEGFGDFTNGLQPDILLEERLSNLGQLGDPEEPFLARAIQEINGTSAKSLLREVPDNQKIRAISSSNRRKPFREIMYKDFF